MNAIKYVLINGMLKCDHMIDYAYINVLNFWLKQKLQLFFLHACIKFVEYGISAS